MCVDFTDGSIINFDCSTATQILRPGEDHVFSFTRVEREFVGLESGRNFSKLSIEVTDQGIKICVRRKNSSVISEKNKRQSVKRTVKIINNIRKRRGPRIEP